MHQLRNLRSGSRPQTASGSGRDQGKPLRAQLKFYGGDFQSDPRHAAMQEILKLDTRDQGAWIDGVKLATQDLIK